MDDKMLGETSVQTLLASALLSSLVFALILAAITDIHSRKITNRLNASIALGAPLFWYASGLSLLQISLYLGVAILALIVLSILFAFRMMGGGDVKLLAALALWIPPLWFGKLLIFMALIGGILTLACLFWHTMRRHKDRPSIPYGVAISSAGLWVLANIYSPLISLQNLRAFTFAG